MPLNKDSETNWYVITLNANEIAAEFSSSLPKMLGTFLCRIDTEGLICREDV